ncbi:DHA2 family efflux MFS transporter permease subunit [Salinibacterium hongtaonis]|uniref:MFS transporter n=1 Tax=Homoserinimonas hongtaonis TaxID=2079791 RepID=A0A2U1T2W8_9MICO|nr:DHA2 family efflux MFS transporter permease subunit [Salinibacterium hongtaonis]PWB98219.1 MFS transporter [Salinibacterium hongtaonis]
MENVARPWAALWALVIGFFMILVDTTIVSVANPSIMAGLGAGINEVIWVTSAYLLAYAVPLLITGRLGDRFGPKNLYLTGLVVFTLASAWCGFAGSIEALILARVVQGLGAALMTPQTMAVITRVFPPDRRGAAMGIWGAVAGIATLVGPVLGGVLVDSLGWEWIFFINVPIGVVAFIMAFKFVPSLSTHPHRFDILGVVLSAVGMFLLVFGIQEGESHNWGTIVGPITVPGMIVSGVVVLVLFVLWQAFNKRGEPLLPLALFRDRNFSLANGAITAIGFAVTSMSLPLVFFFQIVRGLTPTQSALMLVPMAVIAAALAPLAGKLVDKINPRYIAVTGLLLLAISLFWYSALLSPDIDIYWLLLPSALLGIANAGMWSPVSSTATRNLPPHQAGAGSGVYNTTRQIGSVLGSASIAALIQARLAAELGAGASTSDFAQGGGLPPALHEGFSAAMAQSLLLPAAVAVLGAIIVAFFAKPKPPQWGPRAEAAAASASAGAAAGAPDAATAGSPAASPSSSGAASPSASPVAEG